MSNINPNNIDGTFPIAGQDNSSQGFRDNFTNIRNNFSYAQSELNDLQAKAITTSALNGGTLNNNMGYNQLKYAQLFSPSYKLLDQQNSIVAGNSVTLDYSAGSFQKFITTGDHPIAFQAGAWPTSGQFGRMVLWVQVSNTSHRIKLPLSLLGVNDIAGIDATTGWVTFDLAGVTYGNYFFEFISVDAGVTIQVRDLSRNYSTLRDPNFYWNDIITPTLLIGYGSPVNNFGTFNTAIALETGEDRVSALGSYNSVAVSDYIGLATVNSPTYGNGIMGGYTVTAARGNLATQSPQNTTNNDFLGYVNAVTYTGNVGNPSVFAQVSSIAFYATGPSASQGLGGNVAIFTHTPGTTSNTMVQAVGIENDQSVKLFGNLTTNGGIVDTGYQYLAPTTAFWANINPGKSRLIMDPAGTLATGGITLPNCIVDGTIISVHSTQTITALTANSRQTGTTFVPAITTIAAGTGIDFFYHQSENKWYKIR
jgi:hypothetical protein